MQRLNLTILQGKTFLRVVRWEKEPFVYVPITGIARTAPARITAVAHGLTNAWRVAVVSVGGMTEINAQDSPPAETDFVRVTVVDVDTVDLNTVNAAEFTPYTSGGYLQFYTPANLSGCTARMKIRNRVGGTVLASYTTGAGLTLDNTLKTITVQIEAVETATFGWTRGVYDLEIEDGTGVVTGLLYGQVIVLKEVTA